MPKLNVTQASVTALFVWIVGQVVALVPNLGNEQQVLVSAGSTVIAAVFAIVHLVQDYATQKKHITLAELEDGVRNLVQNEVGKVNFAQIAEGVIAGHGLGNISAVVRSELDKILVASGLEQQKAAAQAAAPADPNAPAA